MWSNTIFLEEWPVQALFHEQKALKYHHSWVRSFIFNLSLFYIQFVFGKSKETMVSEGELGFYVKKLAKELFVI